MLLLELFIKYLDLFLLSAIAAITIIVAVTKRKREYLTNCCYLWRVIKDSDSRIVSFHPFIVATASGPEPSSDFKLIHSAKYFFEALSKIIHVS